MGVPEQVRNISSLNRSDSPIYIAQNGLCNWIWQDPGCYLMWSGFPTPYTGVHTIKHDACVWIVAIGGEIFPRLDSSLQLNLTHSGSESVAESLVCAYQSRGIDFLTEVKGWFNLFLYNTTENVAVVANDRYGSKPLFYVPTASGWTFATDLDSLRKASGLIPQVDQLTLIEAGLINFPLGDKTLFQGVKRLPAASCWEFRPGQVTRRQYWQAKSLIEGPSLQPYESLEQESDLFCQVVNQLSNGANPLGLTLTGGFDGRTILSVLSAQNRDVRAFTFGLRNCREARIARKVAAGAQVLYEQIELEDDFREAFESYSRRTVYLSNGQATFLRAHYLYAFEQQAKFGKVFMTGIGGSELIRAVHNTGNMYHQNLASMIAGPNPEQSIISTLENIAAIGFLSKELFYDLREKLHDSLVENLIAPYSGLSRNERFFLLNLCEILPKYFGAELGLEDAVCIVRPPYMDHDFISIIARSPFAAIYNSPFVENPIARRKGQLFYAYTINRFCPRLGYIATDRGYPPIFNLLPLGYLLIAPSYLGTRLARLINPGNYVEALDMSHWTEGLLQQVLMQKDSSKLEFVDFQSVENALSLNHRSPATQRDLAYIASHVLWREEMALK